MHQHNPTRRRWLPRFGLRTLLIVVTAICVLLGGASIWYQSQVAEHRRQQRMAAQLEQLGARVYWKYDVPKWLNGLDNWECFQRIWGVAVYPDMKLKQAVEVLVTLPDVETILLSGSTLNDGLLTELIAMKQLRTLWVELRTIADQERMAEMQPKIQRSLPAVKVDQMSVD